MVFDNNELAPAVFFFDEKGVLVREMLYSEFEAILDGYVPAKEWANRTVLAVYACINSDFRITHAVFFKVSFTREGMIDPSWNLPLDQLANNAAAGPDMGAGPIKLACASQCPIRHFAGMLWDPDLRKGRGQLAVVGKAAELNRIAIQFRPPTDEDLAASHSRQAAQRSQAAQAASDEQMLELRKHMAQLIKEQRLKVATLDRERQRELQELKKDYANRLEDYRQLLESKGRALEEEKQRNQQLKETIDGQADKIAGLREYFEHKLAKREGEESEYLAALRQNYEAEAEARISSATTELKEMLQMREVELLYRNEREVQLHDEITRLRQENEEYVANSGDRLLDRMADKGVSFVTYQPGAGHITIPTNEVARFLDNPVAYAAETCGVKEAHYTAWLEHYQAPVCSGELEDGSQCSANIDRVNSPTEFHIGQSDRCEKHQEYKKDDDSSLKLAGA